MVTSNFEIDSGINQTTGHTVPDIIFYNPNLSDKAKLLAALMDTHQLAKSRPINKFYAKELRCTERTIVRLRNELKEEGFIVVREHPGLSQDVNVLGFTERSEVNTNTNNNKLVTKQEVCPRKSKNLLINTDRNVKFVGNQKPVVTRESRSLSVQYLPSNLPRKVRKIIEVWMDLNLTKHDFRVTNQTTSRIYHDLKKLVACDLYGTPDAPGVLNGHKYRGRDFTIAEIRLSMERFELARTDKFYAPRTKSHLKTIGLGDFFYNPRSKTAQTASWFIWYLENEPTELFNPEVSNRKMYEKTLKAYGQVTGNGNLKLKGVNKSHLIDLSNKLNNFVANNKKTLPKSIVKYEFQAAMFLMKCALEYYKDDIKEMIPFRIKAPWIFEALPNYIERHKLTTF